MQLVSDQGNHLLSFLVFQSCEYLYHLANDVMLD